MPSPPYTFSSGVISSAEVNANFAKLEECLDASGGEVSGTIVPDTTNSRNLGSAAKAFANVFSYLFKLLDTDASHTLALSAGSNLTANRTLTIVTGDASRQLTLTADSTLGGTAYVGGGTDVALADGGTGASLADPNADRIMFWDDSAGAVTWLTVGSNLSISGTTLSATSGLSISGTDERVVRCDGTSGLQSSGVTLDDSNNLSGVAQLTYTTTNVMSRNAKSNNTAYLAASDGFAVVVLDAVTGGGGSGTGTLQTDSSNPPTTLRGIGGVSNGYDTFCVPVKKGDYYRLTTNTTSGTVAYSLEWVPLGTGGA